MTGQPVIRLRLFGRFSAVGDGVPPLPLRIASRKGIALLAYLALHPDHTASREKLATLLWGDRPDQQARLNLRQCMLSLRNALAPAANSLFILDGDAIGLRMELVSVDIGHRGHKVGVALPPELDERGLIQPNGRGLVQSLAVGLE